MAGHSVAIGLVAYIVMLYVLKQSPGMAEDRSVLLGALALVYMVLFGHGSPMKGIVNRNIM